jgi:hypothetical protein
VERVDCTVRIESFCKTDYGSSVKDSAAVEYETGNATFVVLKIQAHGITEHTV